MTEEVDLPKEDPPQEEPGDVDPPPQEDPPVDPPTEGDEPEGEVVVTLGDEPAEQDDPNAPGFVNHLRRKEREAARENRELKARLQQIEAAQAPKTPEVGPEPSLEDEDVQYDADKFKAKYRSWMDRKAVADQQAADAKRQADEAQAAWDAKRQAYNKARDELKVPDYKDAEAAVISTFNLTQQAILIRKGSPAITYALGKNEKAAKELAAIKDPIDFAFKVAELEQKVKVMPRKTPPPPEKTLRGSATVTGGAVDSHLAKLRAEAEKTGDSSKVIAYQRDQQRMRA